MSKLFLETLCVKEGLLQNLSYHQERIDRTLHHFNITTKYDLKTLLTPPSDDFLRCRILYNSDQFEVSFHDYQKQTIQKLQLVTSNNLHYDFKYADRSALERLSLQKDDADDILIVKDGFITDTTIANIAFFNGEHWLTPKSPLLLGTTRARLLDEKKIITADIHVEDIQQFQYFALMNAMIGFTPVKNGIISPLK